MEEKQITAKSYTLRTENGGWLGQIDKASEMFAEKILPPLQELPKKEIESENN